MRRLFSNETQGDGDNRVARRALVWSLVPLGALGGFLGGRKLRPALEGRLDPAMNGEIGALHLPFGRVLYYAAGPSDGTPLLLIHSINAAASAYEVKPLFDHYAQKRPVYALDLPGFGLSDRKDRIYTPRLMTDAILAMVDAIRKVHGHFPIDVMALSLGCEFAARAATEHPLIFRSLAFVSPTGFETRLQRRGETGTTFGKPSVLDVVSFPPWGRALFDGLVSRPSMSFFLRKTWGSPNFDRGLLDYGYASAHRPGAEHAPFSFVAGFLFSRDALTLYEELAMPVWMCHGVRGDFVDYGRKDAVSKRPNWTIRVLQTGAFPQFECLGEVSDAYDAFLDRIAA